MRAVLEAYARWACHQKSSFYFLGLSLFYLVDLSTLGPVNISVDSSSLTVLAFLSLSLGRSPSPFVALPLPLSE